MLKLTQDEFFKKWNPLIPEIRKQEFAEDLVHLTITYELQGLNKSNSHIIIVEQGEA